MTDLQPDELGPAISPASEQPDHSGDATGMIDQPVEAIGAGREEIDLYDDKVQEGIAWTMRQWGEALGLETWTQGDGSESVEGDVGAEIHTILVDAGLRDPETNEMAALSPASPARTPMGEPQVLKGVGKINGDGWKDTTSIGEVVYVWNAEKPSPYAPGQYPRIDNDGWSASTAQYDFSPASVDEVRALAAPTPMGGDREHSSRCWGRTSFSDEVLHCYCQAAPTPMGGEVEALREAASGVADALHDAAHVKTRNLEAAITNLADLKVIAFKAATALRQALAASSPSPAQGGSVADLRMSDERAKKTTKPMHVDDATGWVIRVANGNIRFWSRDQVLVERKASEWGLEAAPEPLGPRPFVPPAGEVEDALSEVTDRIPDTILHGNSFGHQGFYPHAAIKTLVAALYAAAPPSVQPVEGK